MRYLPHRRIPKPTRPSSPAPSYTCLSYVWGSDAGIHSIMINGDRFEVHENLYAFLRMLARKRRPCAKSLWIDALCIDQTSIRERNHQVQQMGQIYSQAKEVVVWLGEDEGIADLFRFAATLTPFNRRSDAQNLSQYIDAIHDLFDHVYWSRAWITQELALASATHFTALDASISLNTLNLLGTRLKHTYGENMIQKMWSPIRQYQRAALRLTIFDNLLQYQNKECTDERDLVYSLLSMSRNGEKIQVNYQCTTLELALDVLRS
ncbi:heterokaryon incompatibility protein-domain-containing protein, partial [Paraphoma chrysanthemicola]